MSDTFVPLALVIFALQDPSPGISRDLAAARAEQITGVAYDLEFTLGAQQDEVAGHAVIRFTLKGDPPAAGLVLDFDGKDLRDVRLNGVGADHARRVHDHIVFPADRLSKGENEVEATFTSGVAATGTPLTRYRDSTSGKQYLYTLLVPADAHRLFPCFDQPDLKATFTLRVVAPAHWQVVGNAEVDDKTTSSDGTATWQFAPTPKISTYLFAFAAGEWEVVDSPFPLRASQDKARGMRLYLRPEEKARADVNTLFTMHARAVDALATQFDQPYPFSKLDFVLVPGFPYGGMEHPGAIFYRDNALSFDHVPTAGELVNRSALIYHEVSHQWFGNLVSFVWFDDLWLKEGFATFIGYQLIEALEPERRAWVAFHRRVKPRAYEVDVTPGTTPIYQALANLSDAKSAYGAIVYNKAPAVLRELETRLSPARFRAGVRAYLRRFAWGNATWKDLVAALEQAAEQPLTAWSDAWILAPGLPRVRAEWSVGADGRVAAFALRQDGGDKMVWPLRLQVLAVHGGEQTRADVVLQGGRAEVPALVGRPAFDWVILNPGDQAYGLFLLDQRSVDALLRLLPSEHATTPTAEPDAQHNAQHNALTRAVALSALRETMREGELDPLRFGELLLASLASEREPEAHAWLLDALASVCLRYLAPARAADLRARTETLLCAQLDAAGPALQLQLFRALARIGQGDAALQRITTAVTTQKLASSVALGPQDCYLGLAALIAAGSRSAVRAGDLRERLPKTDDVARFAYLADAATPTAASKAHYFDSYLDAKNPPEQWVQQSLGYFHWPGQDDLTFPFLRQALQQVEWVKQNRKIFFMPAWIDGFVNGHSSKAALAVVEQFLTERPDLGDDVRRKILQSLDELRRVVAIRARWK